MAGLLRLLERIVGREHDALVAERRDGAVERLGRAHAGRGDLDVRLDVVRHRVLQPDVVEVGPGAAVEAPQQERQGLAHMAEADARLREAVEHAAEDQPQRVRAGFEGPLPGGAAQPRMALQHRRDGHRVGRMDVDQRAERLGALPERAQRWMIEILPVGVAVDHGAAEFQLLDATRELVGRGLGVLHRQMREAGIAVGPFLDFLGQEIVAGLGRADRRRGVALGLDAGSGEGQHGALDAGLVHRCQPRLAEVGVEAQKPIALGGRHLGHGGIPVFDETRTEKVLFEGDFLDHCFSRLFAFRVL